MTTQLQTPHAAAPAAPARSSAKKARQARRPGARRNARRAGIFGYLMITPSIVLVGIFTFIPIIFSLVLSFFSWDVISPPKFIGLANYEKMFTSQPVMSSFGITIVIAAGIVVTQLVVGLFLAVLVENRKHASTKAFFRTSFYLPLLASTAAVSIFMGYMFDKQFGVINYYLTQLGLPQIPWLISPVGAVVTVILITVWQQVGFTFVLFVAALASVPQDVLEAASIDGAGPFRSLFKVKVPLISPTILFAAVIATINAMQLFDQPFIMTKGGPGTATTTATMSMYQAGFQNLQFGYGSAIAILLLAVILAITGIQFFISRKTVFYQ